MNNIKIGYVIAKRQGRDAATRGIGQSLQILRFDRFTYPKAHEGPLYVLESLSDTVDFMADRISTQETEYTIYKVIYSPTDTSYTWYKDGKILRNFVTGTKLASRIKLKSEVDVVELVNHRREEFKIQSHIPEAKNNLTASCSYLAIPFAFMGIMCGVLGMSVVTRKPAAWDLIAILSGTVMIASLLISWHLDSRKPDASKVLEEAKRLNEKAMKEHTDRERKGAEQARLQEKKDEKCKQEFYKEIVELKKFASTADRHPRAKGKKQPAHRKSV